MTFRFRRLDRGAGIGAWPRLVVCEGCGERVLKVKRDLHAAGRPVLVDARELMPPGRCLACRGRGTVTAQLYVVSGERRAGGHWLTCAAGDQEGRRHARRVDCYVCGGTGCYPDLPPRLVAVSAAGEYRPFSWGRDERAVGEALYAPHACAGRAAA